MKKKKTLWWIIVAVIIIVASFFIYNYYVRKDASSTLTVAEKQWIEKNKNNMLDFGIMSNIPVFTSNGSGVLFDFFADLEKNTGLEFNRIPVDSADKVTTDYSFKAVKEKDKKDILVYEDYYVLLSLKEQYYTQVKDITKVTIGVLKNDMKELDGYLTDHNEVKYQSFDDVTKLISSLTNGKVDMIALPKMYNLNEIATIENVHINYNITDMKRDYVISYGNNKTLNAILKKYYKKWKRENYTNSFNQNFGTLYFDSIAASDKDKSSLSGKKYTYGYVSNKPYNANIDGSLYGYNVKQVKTFSDLSGTEVEYKEFDSYEKLIEAFNTNQIDFFYNDVKDYKYNMDVYKTASLDDAKVVVLSPLKYELQVNTLASLNNKEVLVLKNSKIDEILSKQYNVKTIGYNTISSLISHKDKNDILVIDYNSYQYYKNSELSNYKIDYVTSIGNYGYVIRDISDNKAFSNYFNFYLSVAKDDNNMNMSIYSLLKIGNKPYLFKNFMIALISIVVIILGYLGIKKYKEIKSSNPNISKTDKLKYIDDLTSLKNRVYLNDHIEAWDNSEVYPQTIIIVDLNNIAYINDNYGHQEGDEIIKEAANKLITTQIENSDIIRTNGNEFLIYLVGYSEKQIITYIRKINKEMQDLSHGYGAAVGYSMINDAIKTIDDAVNEATIDMRNNKEELNN